MNISLDFPKLLFTQTSAVRLLISTY